MIIVVQQNKASQYTELLEQMFRLRARVFHDQLGWDVKVVNGMECDRYDDDTSVYIIYSDDDGRRVIGSLRLLRTTGPTLLDEFFSDTRPDAAQLASPAIWECTRFCIDEEYLKGNHGDVFEASSVLLAALGEVALAAGIQSVIGNFVPKMLRLYRRIGCEVEVQGSTDRYGDPVYLGSFPVTERILQQIKEKLTSRRQRRRFVEIEKQDLLAA